MNVVVWRRFSMNLRDTLKAWLFSLCLLGILGTLVMAGDATRQSGDLRQEQQLEQSMD
jgi:hypothetical protein